MSGTFDAIVVGCGGVGSAALFHLANAGAKVLGIDRFGPGHEHGSSHGETRIIRLSYFEHPDYVPLLRRSYELWSQLEFLCGEQLYHETGLLQVGPADGVVVPGVLRSAAEHGLSVEQLEAGDAAGRFPGFRLPRDHVALFEARAGVLRVEACVEAHLRAAQDAGAELRHGLCVQAIEPEGGGVRVVTSDGVFKARRVIVAAGAWAGSLLAFEGLPLEVVRKSLFWFEGAPAVYRATQGAPAFFFETADGMYYGFPTFESGEVKLAEHSGGTVLDDPLVVNTDVLPHEEQRVSSFLRAHLPGVPDSHSRHASCLYTKTPDEHFIVDHSTTSPQISFAAGLSGHGFKFVPVIGELLADLALERSSQVDAGFLSMSRF